MKRVIFLVIDSLGIGYAQDAGKYGDVGANTFGHIAEHFYDKRNPAGLNIPNLQSLGLCDAYNISCNEFPAGLAQTENIIGAYGSAKELSTGKDTTSGHWEMTGVPVFNDWGYFKNRTSSLPVELVDELIKQANLPGILGNKHASGTDIIKEYGAEHIRTGKPIVYTSADSVVQIACHEEYFGLDRLIEICQIARALVDSYNIARVIARPFLGESADTFQRTINRKDLSVPPLGPTLFDSLVVNKGAVIGIGKIPDIFCHQGITESVKASSTDGLMDATIKALATAKDRTILCTNFVDFDSSFGHRRDIDGYGNELEHFDKRLPELLKQLNEDDLLFITADHGCDPSWPGSDHTRENVPVLVYGKNITLGSLGERNSFADLGQTIATFLDLPPLAYGECFLDNII